MGRALKHLKPMTIAAILLLTILSTGYMVPLPHKRPNQWLTVPSLSGSLGDKENRKRGRGERILKVKVGPSGRTFEFSLPEDVFDYCKGYAEAKNLTVSDFLGMIIAQGIGATSEAEDYL